MSIKPIKTLQACVKPKPKAAPSSRKENQPQPYFTKDDFRSDLRPTDSSECHKKGDATFGLGGPPRRMMETIRKDDPSAKGLTIYIEQRLRDGNNQAVAELFKQCGDRPEDLGYAIAATRRALGLVTSDDNDKAAVLNDFLGVASAVIGGPEMVAVAECLASTIGGKAMGTYLQDKNGRKLNNFIYTDLPRRDEKFIHELEAAVGAVERHHGYR